MDGWTRRGFLGWCGGTAIAAGAAGGVFAAAKGRWTRERIYRGEDPLSGAKVDQLTSAAAISFNIYGEQLYCSAKGTRIAFYRAATSNVRDGAMELFVADLHEKGVKRMGTAGAGWLAGGNGRQDALFYLRTGETGGLFITRLNYTTLEQEDVFEFGDCPPPKFRGLLAVSPEERYCMILRQLGGRRYGIERIDLEKGTWGLIHEKDDIFNGHLQYNPAGGELMVQQNRGGELTEDFNVVRSVGQEGATLYVIGEDGKNERPLPLGKPHTTPVTGHECWVGTSGRVICTARGGKVYTAAPGDEKARLIGNGAGFIHLTASPDGRFFVVDSIGTGRLFLGCIATRRIEPLCDSGASGGSPQYTHTHPYITPGNARVIFNSDRTGIAQVYAARIPDELLAKLERA